MNNEQFRRLVASKPGQQDTAITPRAGATPSSLGAKKSSFMPMTPRNVKGGADVDFARQVRERNTALQPVKKFRSSAPKGTKFGTGFTDRAKARAEAEEGGDEVGQKAERIKALEEQMKLGQISKQTFEALRDQITGGDVSSTHLVKGLDRQLLERVRRGEDVMGVRNGAPSQEKASPDIENELDKLGEKDVQVVKKEKTEKRGVMVPPPISGKKRTRDEIMAELKAHRKAAAEARVAADPKLGTKWAKVGDKKKPKIEIDGKGREVLITVDEKGVVKKRVRKLPTESERTGLAAPDTNKAVLGADVVLPEAVRPEKDLEAVDDDDGDIFEGVGTDYNPLGNYDENEDESEDESEDERGDSQIRPDTKQGSPAKQSRQSKSPAPSSEASENERGPAMEPPARPKPSAPRNYFNDKSTSSKEASAQTHLLGIQEVLKKAAKMDPLRSKEAASDDEDAAAKEARAKKRAQMLANQDRDLEDMDMGFGSSRLEDEIEEEGDGKKVKLSEWKGTADGGWEEDDGKAGGKKKRKPKKRKGDANNMSDIMRVIEGRKGGAAK